MTAQREGNEANINQWRKTHSPSPQMDCSRAQFPERPAQGHPRGRAGALRVTGCLLAVPRESGCSWPILPSPPFSISLCSRTGFRGGSVKSLPAMRETQVGSLDQADPPGKGYPLQHSCLGNAKDRGPWRATVHGGHKSPDTTEQLTLSLHFLPGGSTSLSHR